MKGVFVVFLGVAVCALVSAETAEPANPFMAGFQSLPNLLASQEVQRRWADIYLGSQQSHHWMTYATVEHTKAKAIAKAHAAIGSILEVDTATPATNELETAASLEDNNDNDNDNEDDDSFLELKSQFFSPGFGLGANAGVAGGMFPFFGGNFFGGLPQNDSPAKKNPSVLELEKQSSVAKQTALKYMQIQLYLVANDVQRTHWVNKILSSLLPPQLMYFKLYKQYLTTLGLGLAFQLHDAFTTESRLDDFNDYFVAHSTAGTTVKSEAVAEVQVYSTWASLASVKMQLFYLSLYEKSAMNVPQQQVQQNTFQNVASSFIELEEKPFVGNNPNALAQQYLIFNQYVSLIRMYILYSEYSLASMGLFTSSTKNKALDLEFDGKAENDNEAHKLHDQAAKAEGEYLPSLYYQWSSLTMTKFSIEQYLFLLELQFPQILQARAGERADASLQDMNLVQTEAQTN